MSAASSPVARPPPAAAVVSHQESVLDVVKTKKRLVDRLNTAKFAVEKFRSVGVTDTSFSRAAVNVKDKPAMRALCKVIGHRHGIYAGMHAEAAGMQMSHHRSLTVAIMALSAVTAICVSAAETLPTNTTIPGTNETIAGVSEAWIKFMSGAVLGLVTVLSAINEFMEFQKFEEKHRVACVEHERAFMIIAIAVARDLDGGEDDGYSYAPVVDAFNAIHEKLRRNPVDIPESILAQHDNIPPPWHATLSDAEETAGYATKLPRAF